MLTIRRLNISRYQSSNYQDNESKSLQSQGFRYLTRDDKTAAADIWITSSKTNFEDLPSYLKEEQHNLKLIIHPNSGHDNFPPEFVAEAKFPIIVGNSIRAEAVAEWTLAQFMAVHALSPHQNKWDKNRQWPRKLISGQKILQVGHGHIGSLVSSSLSPLCGENLDIFDPYLETEPMQKLEKTSPPMEENKKYQAILLCCSLNTLNYHFIDEDFLNSLGPNVVIINGARGSLIDTKALRKFLKANPQSFAALDVFENEPDELSEFTSFSNVRLSSHIAGVYHSLDQKILQFVESVASQYIHLYQQRATEKFEGFFQPLLLQNRLRKTPDGDLFLC